MTEIAFEHFDPEFELGNLDINGKPIKPRKKPGRKPNPPSPAQRKAQNRAAQRAFRERKRREMKDAETNIKKCLYMRDQALREVKILQTQVDYLSYENNFLKGQVLNLKIACMANQVSVPKYYDTGSRDKMGAENNTFSKTKGIPQSLEFFLDRKKHIVTLSSEELTAYDTPPHSLSPEIHPEPSNESHSDINNTTPSASNDGESYVSKDDILSASPLSNFSSTLSAFQLDEFTIANIIHSSSETGLDPLLTQYLLQPNTINNLLSQMKDVPPELWLNNIPAELASLIPPEIRTMLSNTAQHTQPTPMFSPSLPHKTETKSHDSHISTFESKVPVESDFWVNMDNLLPPRLNNKLYVDGPIPPLEAVNKMRGLKDQNNNRYLLTPTELQRKVPHDPRIDVIPGSMMRDYMIIFQDYYDANELFNFLIEHAVFIGGELGNPDCWFVPPQFISKYWFLCPNSRPNRPDNSVEFAIFFAKKMIESLNRRKEMYILRENHVDKFPEPTANDYTNFDSMEEEEEEEEESYFRHDAPIDILVINSLINNPPRVVSPNAFTI
ncbi:hypothetical protein BDB01DRAFT_780175 [Pilobolus umbonatus]|nr:hypothetical protein BDB01DRAFT_780175 [Pilobolus umbonatus]